MQYINIKHLKLQQNTPKQITTSTNIYGDNTTPHYFTQTARLFNTTHI